MVMPPQKLYSCKRCGRTVRETDIKIQLRLYNCGTIKIHKDCGGEVKPLFEPQY